MANFSEDQGYYLEDVGTSWNLMTQGAASLGLNVETGEVTKSYIKEKLTQSTPMICSMRSGTFTTKGHFIVLTDIDSNGMIKIHDPNSLEKSEKLWSVEELLPQIKAIWRYSV